MNEFLSPTATQNSMGGAIGEQNLRDKSDIYRDDRSATSEISRNLRTATSPLTIRARLTSLGRGSPILSSKTPGSSILTLQGPKAYNPVMKPPTVASDSESESDDGDDIADEEKLHEEEALQKRLQELQQLMNNETLGLVRQNGRDLKGKIPQRGRDNSAQFVQKSDATSNNGSLSTTSSPQGSIPSIPSPSPDSLPHSPVSRHLSPAKKSSSPPAISIGNARGQSHMQYKHPFGPSKASAKSSTQNSATSSFSEINGKNGMKWRL